ncbi:MAG: dihydrofolate reductase family protein [Balneolales bacterium]
MDTEINDILKQPSTIKENVVDEITRLKQQSGQDILITGNAALVQSLEEADLVDEYRFLVHPIMMGRSKCFLRTGYIPH